MIFKQIFLEIFIETGTEFVHTQRGSKSVVIIGLPFESKIPPSIKSHPFGTSQSNALYHFQIQ